MSKIVIIDTRIEVSTRINELINEVAEFDQQTAENIRNINHEKVIIDCALNALKLIKDMRSIHNICTDNIEYPYYFNDLSRWGDTKKVVASIKLNNFRDEVYLTITKDNNVKFFSSLGHYYGYEEQYRKEMEILKDAFENVFLFEMTKATLQIVGYDIETESVDVEEKRCEIEGVKI